jgi:signal transduction histidine kinase
MDQPCAAKDALPADCARGAHPLEVMPFFRRFRPSPLRDAVYTVIWSTLFAIVFTVITLMFEPQARVARAFWANLVIANCIGAMIHAGFEICHPWLGAWARRQSFALRTAYYGAISIFGVFAGYWLGLTLLGWPDLRAYIFSPQGAVPTLLLSLVIAAILASFFLARERQARAEAAAQRERARVEAAEHQFHLAQLKLLEAQIEPHFLYNTLANVISLVDNDPAGAKRMLERLIDYLRRASAASTPTATTLGTQIELLRAYLDLLVLRMGRRLAYRIEIPRELDALPLPPMLLQPLVENAIKHGLEPKVAGGEVSIVACRGDSALVLTVADNGEGFRTLRGPASAGIGLANLRARLATLYGDAARLVIEDAHPGTRATIELPMPVAA